MTIITSFSSNPLDRADILRGDDHLFTDRFKAGDSAIILFSSGDIITNDKGTPHWFNTDIVSSIKVGNLIFLGLDGNQARYAADIDTIPASLEGYRPMNLRSLAMQYDIPGADAGLLGIIAQARATLNWHASHVFCSKCGAETMMVRGGYERKCTVERCGASHFPRTDPVVIMLAVKDDRVLLGRSPHFPSGMFSALAGFMEPGETIEEAVRRELMEEAGIKTSDVAIIANQPWPFPSSLMIGCIATAISEDIHLDDDELDDARWFTAGDLRQITRGQQRGEPTDIIVPPPFAIAHTLLKYWLEN